MCRRFLIPTNKKKSYFPTHINYFGSNNGDAVFSVRYEVSF